MKKIIVCICTYNRNDLLLNLISDIIKQESDNYNLQIFVVDNSEDSNLENIIPKNEKIIIRYFNEKTRGITFARNRCLEEVRKYDFDYCILLDDDEYLDKEWLKKFIKCAEEYDADIITGPVISVYPDYAPIWIKKTGFFDRSIKETGEVLKTCGAGNVLIKKNVIDDKSFKFNNKYAFTGGEDTELFLKMTLRGKKIIYCKEAKAYEEVNKTRLNAKYMLKRRFVNSITLVNIEKELLNIYKVFLKRILSGSLYTIIGTILFPVYIFAGKTLMFKSLELIVKGTGQLSGLWCRGKKLY